MFNPLKDHLNDDTFHFLRKHNLIREKGLRDYAIRQRFKVLRRTYPTYKIIEMLQEEYPYLQYETIRKIIYQRTACVSE